MAISTMNLIEYRKIFEYSYRIIETVLEIQIKNFMKNFKI